MTAPVSGVDDGFANEIADQVESFLVALRAIAVEGDPGRAVPLLLLEISQLLLAGARVGVQNDFTPRSEFQPDVARRPMWRSCGCGWRDAR